MIRPTLRQLEYIVAIADEGHFGRAARVCGVTQPGLSTQVRQLEELLDCTIFERDRRGVIVTPAGAELVERARRILIETDELVEASRVGGAPLTGDLRLGVIPTIAPYLLPRVLPRLRRKHRDLRLMLREDHTARLVEALEAGTLDVLLLAREADLRSAATLDLFQDDFHVLMTTDHPLANKKNLSEADLKGENILLLEDGHCLRDQALAVCGSESDELGDFRATSLGTLTQMITAPDVLTLLPEIAVPVETRGRRDLTTRPFRAPVPHRTICLAWRASSPRASEFVLLAESLKP